MPGLSSAAADLRARVGDRGLELLADDVGLVEELHGPLRRAAGRGHLPLRLLEIHDPPADRRRDHLRHDERLPVALVEPLGDVAGELDVLALVLADRDGIGLVEQDVRRLEDGVAEEARRDEVLAVALVLELGHAAQLAVARDRAEQPRGLGVRGHVALDEDGRAIRVEAGREEHRREVERRVAQLRRVVLDGDRVQVDDAEERVALLLRLRVLAEAARVVPEMLVAGRLDARKDPHGLTETTLRERWPSQDPRSSSSSWARTRLPRRWRRSSRASPRPAPTRT